MTNVPWDDCKVAFGIDDADPFDDIDCMKEMLPKGWEVNEVDGTGARWVVVFRVTGPVSHADGDRVRKALKRIGAIT